MTDQIYAFPGEHTTHLITNPDGRTTPFTIQHAGMTLRDYFAGQALAGLAGQFGSSSYEAQKHIAERCYSLADAMLAERAKASLSASED